MAFWLARERKGQHSDFIQRFDPRFWTVNFPRPMMASVVTTGPDSLRIDCEFHHNGELAGLIWESEDRLDHPLLAYDTVRDYAHCTLSFRWKSSDLVALDAQHGPTLTIEGRDASGTRRSWYVRLWNYASGTAQDAAITLPFSALESGWSLPGEQVYPRDIDRMFISLAPPGYVEGGSDPLPNRINGWAAITKLRCEGQNASIPIGDVLLPAHGVQMATAYDDSFNQTPARLVRTMEGLGYRGRVIHYVGMSHYYRLYWFDGRQGVNGNGTLATPARRWHEDFFARTIAADFQPIISLSFELFAEHCREGWNQLAHDGAPALTGWEPPSTLLSPANDIAMRFLQRVAENFVGILADAGGEILFQIGEPWWWVRPDDRAPCLYDPAAQAALPGGTPPITDMSTPMGSDQIAYLDAAGAVLAQATADLAQAVRDAAPGDAEILLLAFTPTVLDPEMPELHRACLPAGWARPAFDRFQLEDYDWLTAGRDANRRIAYAQVTEKLGYPPQETDYFSGFVLLAEDSETLWPKIDAGLDEAADRGIEQRYVWALPQVARDGYTRLPPGEDTMNPFDDVAYPLALGRDASASPEFSTSVAVTASGYEHRNALWSDARMRYDVGPGIRSEKELGSLIAFFRARYGPARGFRLRDPFDYSSGSMTGACDATDQLLGTGDAVVSRFRLVKHYGEQQRAITRPEVGSIVVAVDGAQTTGWSYEEGGWIVFDDAPANGAQVTAGFHFDVPVRFAEDRLDVGGLSFAAGEAPSVPLIEIREAA